MALSPAPRTNLYKGVDAQADLARKRAQQNENVNLGNQKEAMARRAAQLGGGPSGALIKQDTIAESASAERLQAANEGIEAARMGEHSRIGQVLQGQEFSRSERLGSQKWQSGEAATQRVWQSGEAETQRKWGTSERLEGQTFTAGQNAAQIEAQYDMQKKQIEAAAAEGVLNRTQADRQLAELSRQFEIETAASLQANHVATILSAVNSKLTPDQIGGLLKSLGIDFAGVDGLTQAAAPVENPGQLPPMPSNLQWKPGSRPGWGWDPDKGRWVQYAEGA